MPPARTPKKEEVEYTKATSTGKKADAVRKIITAYKKSTEPLVFQEACAKAGAKYPQDVEAALFALETVGLVERLDVKADGKRRTAYRWIA